MHSTSMLRDEWAEIGMQTPRSCSTSDEGCVLVLINAFPGGAVLSIPLPEPMLHPFNMIVIADNIKKTVFFIF